LTDTALPADPAAAWLSLLPHAEAEDVREWLGERGAYEVARGVPDGRDPSEPRAHDVVGQVLAELRGHPMRSLRRPALRATPSRVPSTAGSTSSATVRLVGKARQRPLLMIRARRASSTEVASSPHTTGALRFDPSNNNNC
jgi:hypothetical protein